MRDNFGMKPLIPYYFAFPLDMEGQIEGLSIAGRSCGLWNFKNSFKVMAARGRDRLREKNEEGLK